VWGKSQCPDGDYQHSASVPATLPRLLIVKQINRER
jgi:hypothetical protein